MNISQFLLTSVLTGIIFLSSIYAQGYTFSGRTFNEAGKKIGPVRIVIYDIDKKKIVDITTPKNGKFKFKDIPDGNYTLNLYGDNGYTGSENITISGANKIGFEPQLSSSDDQPQINLKYKVESVEINWRKTVGAVEYIIYRDNDEVGKVAETIFIDKILSGKTYGYNVVAVMGDESTGKRSLTEYGKALLPAPIGVKTVVRKNIVKLDWDSIESVSAYKVYRDSEMINTTSENTFTDFKLKYGTEFSYTIAALDHQGDAGDRSLPEFATTHQEMLKPEKLKAESGTSQVDLTWEEVPGAIQYRIYLNGALVDSSKTLLASISTEPGEDNCFAVSAQDKYGSEGVKSDAACDKSVYSPPDSIQGNNQLSKNLIKWSKVPGASSYNIYRDGKLLSNTAKDKYTDGVIKWNRDYEYHLSSLTDEGVEGPESNKITVKVPPVFVIEGTLIAESGNSKDIDEAKVFLYTKDGKMKDEYSITRNGQFRFEKEIVTGEYTVKAYGDGSGNGGERINVNNKDLKGLKIRLSTEGLVPTLKVVRGVGQLTAEWDDFPQVKAYAVYKNNRLLSTVVGETSFLDPNVAPGIPTTYDVRTIDVYDLEGPKSNIVIEKSSFTHPAMTPLILTGGYTKDGSGRVITLSWQAIAGVDSYALYRDGKLLSKQSETIYEDSDTKYETTYQYEINSIDKDNIEGVNSPKLQVSTHIELIEPEFKLTQMINAVSLNWPSLSTATSYKIFRNGSNIADTPDTVFIDNVKSGVEYCYSVTAEDSFKTVGPEGEIKCGRGYFAPPGNFGGEVIRNEVFLSWTSILGVSGYRLFRDGELVHSTPDGSEYLDKSLSYNTEYLYEIASIDQDETESPRIKFNILTHEEVLPTELIGESDLEKITLFWKKSNLIAEHRYRIYRDGELLDETKDTTYQDVIPAGRFYCYTIGVIDHYGTESLKSNEECHKVLVKSPTDLLITGDVKRVMFDWKKMIGANFYNIYTVNKESGDKTFHTKTKQNFYEHKDLIFDTEYCYKVSSVDADGDEGPLSDIQCGWVLPPPHITLIEKRFVEASGNNILDGREHGWIIAKIVNDGRSPARELKPWLEPLDGAATPSLKIDPVTMIPKLDIGDTLTIHFSIYAKLKIESGERNFNIRIGEYTGLDLEPEPITFTTLKVLSPNLVVTDFAIDSEWGQHYIPKNETVTMSVRIQNLSEGKSDTASVRFRRDSTFIGQDEDELHQFGFVNAHEVLDFSFEIFSREDKFTVYLDVYDYFETRTTFPIHLETFKDYKGADELILVETPYPKKLLVGEAGIELELTSGIPTAFTENGTIGIVLGNPEFWNPDIFGKASTDGNTTMVREYFHDLFGLEDHEIIPSQYWFFNDGVSIRDFQAIFDPDLGYIRKKIESSLDYTGNKSIDLILYYSGEGTTFKNEKVLIPFDADTTNEYSFYSVKELYQNLLDLQNIKEVDQITLFMDIDFNNSAFTQTLVSKPTEEEGKKKKKKKKKKKDKSEESIVVLPKEIMPPKSITAFYASDINQITYDQPGYNNGMFTYYLLRGLRGEADNGDKKVTIAELHEYIRKNVQDSTGKLYKEMPQSPLLFSSNPNRVLYTLP
jgi:fibronectin type 3 domain-containing protein